MAHDSRLMAKKGAWGPGSSPQHALRHGFRSTPRAPVLVMTMGLEPRPFGHEKLAVNHSTQLAVSHEPINRKILRKWCWHLLGHFHWKCWKYFQNVDRNGALLNYNFNRLGSPPNPDFHDFGIIGKCHRPSGALIFDFGSAELLQQIQEAGQILFKSVMFGNLRIPNMAVGKKRVA